MIMSALIRKDIRITEGQDDFLEGLDGLSTSEHIRRAIDEYISKKRIQATISPSKIIKKGVDNGR